MSLPRFRRHGHGNIDPALDVEAMSLPRTEVGKRLWGIWHLHYVASSDAIIDELERNWKETVVAQSRYCPDICVEGLRKITSDLRIAHIPAEI
jgi:hypothetical protein